MLPECARSALMGASEAQAWLPRAQQDALLSQAIRSKSGANGDRLYEAIKTLVFISAFADAMGLEPDSMWPMPRGSAATLISGEHQRAKKAGVGSRRPQGQLFHSQEKTTLSERDCEPVCRVPTCGFAQPSRAPIDRFASRPRERRRGTLN